MDIHDAGFGVFTVQGALGAFEHFDTIDMVQVLVHGPSVQNRNPVYIDGHGNGSGFYIGIYTPKGGADLVVGPKGEQH